MSRFSTRAVIVAVTGWGHEAAKRQSREAGFDHHLVKPVSEAELTEILATITRTRTRRADGMFRPQAGAATYSAAVSRCAAPGSA